MTPTTRFYTGLAYHVVGGVSLIGHGAWTGEMWQVGAGAGILGMVAIGVHALRPGARSTTPQPRAVVPIRHARPVRPRSAR